MRILAVAADGIMFLGVPRLDGTRIWLDGAARDRLLAMARWANESRVDDHATEFLVRPDRRCSIQNARTIN